MRSVLRIIKTLFSASHSHLINNNTLIKGDSLVWSWPHFLLLHTHTLHSISNRICNLLYLVRCISAGARCFLSNSCSFLFISIEQLVISCYSSHYKVTVCKVIIREMCNAHALTMKTKTHEIKTNQPERERNKRAAFFSQLNFLLFPIFCSVCFGFNRGTFFPIQNDLWLFRILFTGPVRDSIRCVGFIKWLTVRLIT